jgi:hypothetical protein
MSLQKILGLVGVVLAVVAAFVMIPYSAVVLGVLGLVIGLSIAAEDHVRVIVSALALTALAGTFATVPTAGEYITAIIGNVGTLAAGAALMIVFRNIYGRFKP